MAETYPSRNVDRAGLLTLTVLALIAGAGTGVIGAAFRTSLVAADSWRNALIASAHGWPVAGFVFVVAGCAAAVCVAAWMVRRFSPPASGSGIPHVEAVLRGVLSPAPIVLAPVKFIGGVLAIGSGLALGREGPTVQMGATIGFLVTRPFRLPWRDRRALIAACAGAGLATAFNAPLAGVAFVLEELVQSFDQRIAIAGLAAAATAIAVMRALLGNSFDFPVAPLTDVTAPARVFFFALGAILGFVGIAYNRAILGASAAVQRLPMPVEARAALIGAGVGAIAWFYPTIVGGGDPLTFGALTGNVDLAVLPLLFLARFGLGAISYATGTPGGLFAPLLTLGAQFGFLYGAACRSVFPWLSAPPESFALVGMAALFAAAVQAPLTGMVLVSEMTGNVSLLLPMLGACALAMLVPKLLAEPPIYDSLREALLGKAGPAEGEGAPAAQDRD
jgi:chloride channel protein, CIC family